MPPLFVGRREKREGRREKGMPSLRKRVPLTSGG